MTCKEFAVQYKADLKEKISQLSSKPVLKIIQVGNNPVSDKYVRGKLSDCEEVGIQCKHIRLPETCNNEDVNDEIRYNDYNGVIVQLPLPEHIDQNKVTRVILNRKDVDGFLPDSPFTPCTPKGILMYIQANNIDLTGKNAVVIGRSNIVGKPMAKLLTDENCTVTLCHSRTKDILEHTRNADIIVAAVGKENILTADMISPQRKPIVIDVGINVGTDGKLHGDCDYNNLVDLCSLITPVPGGVGLLTRCALLENVYQAAKKSQSTKWKNLVFPTMGTAHL